MLFACSIKGVLTATSQISMMDQVFPGFEVTNQRFLGETMDRLTTTRMDKPPMIQVVCPKWLVPNKVLSQWWGNDRSHLFGSLSSLTDSFPKGEPNRMEWSVKVHVVLFIHRSTHTRCACSRILDVLGHSVLPIGSTRTACGHVRSLSPFVVLLTCQHHHDRHQPY